MKVVITHLKAPWPAGAGVGSVVELPGGEIPGFFVGKCKPADEGAEASHVFVPAPPATADPAAVGPAGDASAAEEFAELRALLAAEREATAELTGRLHAVQEQLDAARAELDALKADKPEAATKTGKGKA